jgi:YHS domain-containing protein
VRSASVPAALRFICSPMFRAILELLITIAVVLMARAVLTHFLRSVTTASRNAYRETMEEAERRRDAAESAQETRSTGQLHKDPVCGTYVAESTPYRRQVSGDIFYYCSDACRQAHTPVGARGTKI